MLKLVFTGPEFHIAKGHKPQVVKPFSPLQALHGVHSKSHQNWVDYPSLYFGKPGSSGSSNCTVFHFVGRGGV